MIFYDWGFGSIFDVIFCAIPFYPVGFSYRYRCRRCRAWSVKILQVGNTGFRPFKCMKTIDIYRGRLPRLESIIYNGFKWRKISVPNLVESTLGLISSIMYFQVYDLFQQWRQFWDRVLKIQLWRFECFTHYA